MSWSVPRRYWTPRPEFRRVDGIRLVAGYRAGVGAADQAVSHTYLDRLATKMAEEEGCGEGVTRAVGVHGRCPRLGGRELTDVVTLAVEQIRAVGPGCGYDGVGAAVGDDLAHRGFDVGGRGRRDEYDVGLVGERLVPRVDAIPVVQVGGDADIRIEERRQRVLARVSDGDVHMPGLARQVDDKVGG